MLCWMYRVTAGQQNVQCLVSDDVGIYKTLTLGDYNAATPSPRTICLLNKVIEQRTVIPVDLVHPFRGFLFL